MNLEIAGRRVGAGEPIFVIAELGINHGGSSDRACALVDAAADAGASAIKLQTLHADRLVAEDAPAPEHFAAGCVPPPGPGNATGGPGIPAGTAPRSRDTM